MVLHGVGHARSEARSLRTGKLRTRWAQSEQWKARAQSQGVAQPGRDRQIQNPERGTGPESMR